jgi:hypothetical protein
MLSFNISYWDLIKKFLTLGIPLNEWGDKGWEQAQRHGEDRVTLQITLLQSAYHYYLKAVLCPKWCLNAGHFTTTTDGDALRRMYINQPKKTEGNRMFCFCCLTKVLFFFFVSSGGQVWLEVSDSREERVCICACCPQQGLYVLRRFLDIGPFGILAPLFSLPASGQG